MRAMCKTLALAGLMVCAALAVARAADEPQKAQPAQPAQTAQPGQAGQPNQAQMMAEMMKLAAPGPYHEKLKAFVGKWTADVTTTMMPGGPEEKSTGMMTNEMILGDRYLKQNYEGTMMKMPFRGGGIVGYDNVKKKYTSLWVDEMSTQMMIAEGTMDESAKTITMSSTFDCPMDNAKHTMRQVITMVDDDHHTYEMFDTGPDGKETKALTIKYTRAKE